MVVDRKNWALPPNILRISCKPQRLSYLSTLSSAAYLLDALVGQ
jgi:hypothetical protein